MTITCADMGYSCGYEITGDSMEQILSGVKHHALEFHGWTKEELENILEDVVNELDLSDGMVEKHGPLGTPPAELVRLVLEQKDKQLRMFRAGFVEIPRTDYSEFERS